MLITVSATGAAPLEAATGTMSSAGAALAAADDSSSSTGLTATDTTGDDGFIGYCAAHDWEPSPAQRSASRRRSAFALTGAPPATKDGGSTR